MKINVKLGFLVALSAMVIGVSGASAQAIPDDVEPGCWEECLRRLERSCNAPNPDGSPGPSCVEFCRDACNENNPPCGQSATTTSTTLPYECYSGLCGDFNGDELVSATDCQACLLRAVLLPIGLTCDQLEQCFGGTCGDLNGDDSVSASDCQACLLRAVRLPVGLSCDLAAGPAVSYTRDCRPY